MTKCMVLLWTIFTCNACAQQTIPIADSLQEQEQALYPYRNSAGLFGYADKNLQIHIEPQYKTASLFTEQGFAVVTDSLSNTGVIDKNNRVVIPFDYDRIDFSELDDFTLAEAHKTYYSRLRFWEWKFLPGFNLMGTGNDNRLFDTKVERLKKTMFVLGQKNRKIRSVRMTASGFLSDYSDISVLDSNQILIDGTLYGIDKRNIHSLARHIKAPLTEHTFAEQQGNRLYIRDRKGKKIEKSGYTRMDSIEFKVEDVPVFVNLTQSNYQPIASAYKGEDGQTYIYPDFSKPVPRLLHDNLQTGDLTAEEMLRGAWTIASVPESDYFMLMSFRDGERFFSFLDTQGNWHQQLPDTIPFTVVQRTGDILWPDEAHYVPQDQVPEGWKIDGISQLSAESMYHITLRKDKEVRQGIWDFEKQQWLIAPEYYQVYSLGIDFQQWRVQPEKDGLWGVISKEGNVLLKPTYYAIASDGWVQQQENGKYISFYLHLPTLTEFREK